ncbi:ATP-binding protein, partial [Spongiactinospora gelatinilytica]
MYSATLVVSELVANAVVHGTRGLAYGQVTVRMTGTDQQVHVEVIDQGAGCLV